MIDSIRLKNGILAWRDDRDDDNDPAYLTCKLSRVVGVQYRTILLEHGHFQNVSEEDARLVEEALLGK